jgi:radical SAM superfamily enzyme YgiQ (UPF0313 family)
MERAVLHRRDTKVMKRVKELLGKERWVEPLAPSGSSCIAYPGSYREACSSLGYHFALGCGAGGAGQRAQRTFAPGSETFMKRAAFSSPLRVLETGRSAAGMKLVLLPVSYELQVFQAIEILRSAGLEPLAGDRGRRDPAVIAGGSFTLSNPALLAPFADAVVVGDGEGAMGWIAGCISAGMGKEEIVERLAEEPHVITAQKDPDGCGYSRAPADALPVCSLYVTHESVFRDMFLVEVMRGCPHACGFCVMPSARSREETTFMPARKVLERIPGWVKRVGLVGASVLDHPEIDGVLEELNRRSVEIGMSSMRATKLSEGRARMLAKGGVATATLALDAPSERIRRIVRKPVTRDHVLRAAGNLGRAGVKKVKLYVLVGFADESEEDYRELAATGRELASLAGLSISLAPVVPKRRTALEEMPFVSKKKYRAAVDFLKKRLKGKAALRPRSYRIALREYRLGRMGFGEARELAEEEKGRGAAAVLHH